MPKSAAFTLIECIVVLAVLSVLAGLAVPAFEGLIKRRHAAGTAGELYSVIYLARSEAIKRNSTVTLCKSNDQATCSGSWTDGWILFSDANANRIVDGNDVILKKASGLPAGYTLKWSAFGSTTYLNFHPNGLTNQNGTFKFCPPDNDAEFAKALVISKTGRARISSTFLTCP